jgi:hypothetical protein
MIVRATNNSVEEINRALALIQNQGTKETTSEGTTNNLASDSKIISIDSQISDLKKAIESANNLITELEASKSDIGHTINGYVIENNPELVASDIDYQNNITYTNLQQAMDAALAMFNITQTYDTYDDMIAVTPQDDTVAVVISDRTHNLRQSIYRYSNNQWNFLGYFNVNLSEYRRIIDSYSQEDVNNLLIGVKSEYEYYTQEQIGFEVTNRNNAIQTNNTSQRNITNTDIRTSQNAAVELAGVDTDTKLRQYVPIIRMINGMVLSQDINLRAMDISYTNNAGITSDVATVLTALSGALIYKGVVATYSDLPADALNGWTYVTEDTKIIWVRSTEQWVALGEFQIQLGDYYKKSETYSSTEIDTISGILRTELNEQITSETGQALLAANQYTDDRLDNDFKDQMEKYTDDAVSGLAGNVDGNFVRKSFPYPLVNDVTIQTDDESAKMMLHKYNLNGLSEDFTYAFPMSDTSKAGLMSSAQVNSIIDLQDQMSHIKTGGIYVGQSYETYDELMAAPIDPRWSANDFTYVQKDREHSNLVSQYILEYDTSVPPVLVWDFAFTMGSESIPFAGNDPNHAGIVYGGLNSGDVYSDNGYMSVVGFDDLSGYAFNVDTRLKTVEGKYATKATVTAGTNCKITYNNEGIITGGTGLSSIDIPALNANKITDGYLPIARGGTNTNSFSSDRVVVYQNGALTSTGTPSTTELGYLTGVTSAIQTQLNKKQGSIASASKSGQFLQSFNGSSFTLASIPGVTLSISWT